MTKFKKGDRVRVSQYDGVTFTTVPGAFDVLISFDGTLAAVRGGCLVLVDDSFDPMAGAKSRTDENLRRVFG